MTLVPITMGYNDDERIGHVMIEDTISDEIINECVLGPRITKKEGEDTWKITSFGLIERTTVDTTPRSL